MDIDKEILEREYDIYTFENHPKYVSKVIRSILDTPSSLSYALANIINDDELNQLCDQADTTEVMERLLTDEKFSPIVDSIRICRPAKGNNEGDGDMMLISLKRN